jgi:hypothetical protein
MGDREMPVETFDALLRDLVTWNLVVPRPQDGAEAWELVPRAQQRLAELTRGRGPWPVERTAYLGRRCADCNRRQVTWMRHGEYVCEECWQRRLSLSEVDNVADPTPSRPSRWGFRRRAEIA